jgi:hypothetical protein
METLAKKKTGVKPKFTLDGVENAPIKAKGWAKKYPHQYANFWNNKGGTQVSVVFNKKGEPFFEC